MIAISPTLPRRTSSITCATLVHARSAAIGRDQTARRSKAHEPGKLICTSMRLVLPMVGNALLHTMGGDAVASEPGVAPGAAHVPAALSFGPTSPEKLPATRSHFTPWLQPLTVTDRFLAHCRFHHLKMNKENQGSWLANVLPKLDFVEVYGQDKPAKSSRAGGVGGTGAEAEDAGIKSVAEAMVDLNG